MTTNRDKIEALSDEDLADRLIKQYKDNEGNIYYTFEDTNERFCDWYSAFTACIKWLESEVKK